MVRFEVAYVDEREDEVREHERRIETLRSMLEHGDGAEPPGVARALCVAENKVKVASRALEHAKGADDLAWVDAKQHLDNEVATLEAVVERVESELAAEPSRGEPRAVRPHRRRRQHRAAMGAIRRRRRW